MSEPIIEIKGLSKRFGSGEGSVFLPFRISTSLWKTAISSE